MKLTTVGKLFSVVAGVSLSAMVSAATVFKPTDGDVNTFDLTGFIPNGDVDFAIFAAGADLSGSDFLRLEDFDVVEFTEVAGFWFATNLDGDELEMGLSPNFLITADLGLGDWIPGDAVNYIVGPLPNATFVSFAGDEPLMAAVDVKAVPVPAAVWLFGSGLLGLVGVARRKSA
jgi:hypothetical protein